MGADYDREAAETGFPLLVTTRADRGRWRRDYLRSVVPETLSESDHAIDHSRLTRLLDGIAGIAGHELVISRLVADLAIDRRTASGPAEKYSGVSLGRLVRCCCGGSRVSSVAVRGPVVG